MSKYTTEVRFICEMEAGCTESQGYDKVEEIVELAAPKIFNNFPIFDEAYRLPLEKKILMHYYTREIGEEVVGLWKLRLATRMNEMMPYFNKLYESELLKYEPFYDVDLTTQREMSGQRVGTNKEKNENDLVSANSRTSGSANERDVSESTFVNDKMKNENENSKTGVESATNKIKENNSTSVDRSENNTNVESSTIDSTTISAGDRHTEDTSNKAGSGNTTSDTEGTKNSTDNQTHWDLYSDTPQGTIENIAAGASDHNRYLTNARENTDNDVYEDTTTEKNRSNNVYDETGMSEGDETTNNQENGRTVGSVIRDNNVSTNESNSGEKNTENNGSLVRDYEENGSTNSERSVGRNGLTNENGEMRENEVNNRVENSTATSEKIDTVNNLDSFTERVFGKRGGMTYSKMLMELRDSFINIDEMVIARLGDLFFGLW